MKRVWVSWVLCLLANCCLAQLYYGEGIDEVLEVSDPVYLLDVNSAFSLNQVHDLPFDLQPDSAFAALKKLNRGLSVWVKVDLKKVNDFPEILAMRMPHFSEVRCYLVSAGGTDSVDIGFVDVGHLQLQKIDPCALPLPLAEGESGQLYICIRHYARSLIISRFFYEFQSLSFYTAQSMRVKEENILFDYFYLLFCGLLIFQLVYVLVQWLLVRRREYFYYGLYIVAVFFYFYSRYSVCFAQIPSLARIDGGTMLEINDMLLVLPTIFYLRFARHFADIRRYDPRLYRRFKWAEIILIAITIAIFILQNIPNNANKHVLIGIALAMEFLFAVYAIFRIARQKRTIAWFLIIGSSCALGSSLFANLASFVLPASLRPEDPLSVTMVGILLELVIFNTGLLFKAKESERAKMDAQRAYIKEIQAKQILQSDYISARDKIASDLHDDIGSSLSSIGIYTYAAQQKLEQADGVQTRQLLANIEKTAASTLSAMSDLVWAINPMNDNNEKLVERIRSFAFEILAAGDCQFVSEIDPEFYQISLDQAQRKNVLLILKEAVNNAAKYANAKCVSLDISRQAENGFLVCLTDNGQGFNTEINAGNGMRTMRRRSLELSDTFTLKSDQSGTELCFAVGKSPNFE